MTRWSTYLTKAVNKLDGAVDRVHYGLIERFGKDAIVAFPYLSYGTRERFYIKGRVLEARRIPPAREDASFWENLRNAYKRFETDEIPRARVKVRFQENVLDLESDEEGYFEGWLELARRLPPDARYFQEIEVELLAPLRKRQQETRFIGSVIVPQQKASFGIISDMDDTVLQTGASSIISMAKKVLFGNARTRVPFEGVSAFYRSLHKGINPIFYVSSSPWNLYDLLVEFLDLNDIPVGPLMLRDWGISATELLPTGHGPYKRETIERILATYPALDFILIGDSGQEDPEIYRDIVSLYPGRILAIYIRDVTDAVRKESIKKLATEVATDTCQLILVSDTVSAARHAAERGWLDTDAIEQVQVSMHEDEKKSTV